MRNSALVKNKFIVSFIFVNYTFILDESVSNSTKTKFRIVHKFKDHVCCEIIIVGDYVVTEMT